MQTTAARCILLFKLEAYYTGCTGTGVLTGSWLLLQEPLAHQLLLLQLLQPPRMLRLLLLPPPLQDLAVLLLLPLQLARVQLLLPLLPHLVIQQLLLPQLQLQARTVLPLLLLPGVAKEVTQLQLLLPPLLHLASHQTQQQAQLVSLVYVHVAIASFSSDHMEGVAC